MTTQNLNLCKIDKRICTGCHGETPKCWGQYTQALAQEAIAEFIEWRKTNGISGSYRRVLQQKKKERNLRVG